MKGRTYLSWRGLSINEGYVPNIHCNWSKVSFFIYICYYQDKRWMKRWELNK